MESAEGEPAETTTGNDNIKIKEEPVFNDHYWEPLVEIKQIAMDEDAVKLEMPESQIARDPLELNEEELNYEAVAPSSGSGRESSPIEGDSSADSICAPATRDGVEAGTERSVRLSAEQDDFQGNENGIRPHVLDREKVSMQLQRLEESRHCSLSCSVCHKKFTTRSILRQHLRLHTGERPYSCSVCGKAFARGASLKEHTLTHTGDLPFRCSVCNKAFRHSGHLNRHSVLHTGRRPYGCAVCNKTFTESGHLKKHSLLHTGERPYSCTVCNKAFRESGHLKQHMMMHTGERSYSCTVCSKAFRVSFHLKQHMLLHTGERPYSCTICNKTFTQNSSLKRHLLLHTR